MGSVPRLYRGVIGWVIPSVLVLGGWRVDARAADGPLDQGSAQAIAPVSPLAPVVVTATRSEVPLHQSPTSTTILTQEDIAASGALALDDVLRQIPGFNTFRRSSSLVTGR